jgi:hypothetical protein
VGWAGAEFVSLYSNALMLENVRWAIDEMRKGCKSSSLLLASQTHSKQVRNSASVFTSGIQDILPIAYLNGFEGSALQQKQALNRFALTSILRRNGACC